MSVPGSSPAPSVGSGNIPFFSKYNLQEVLPVFGIPNAACLAKVVGPQNPDFSWFRDKVTRAKLFVGDMGARAINSFGGIFGLDPINNKAQNTLMAYQALRVMLAVISLHSSYKLRLVGALIRFTCESLLLRRHQRKARLKKLPMTPRSWVEIGRAVGEIAGLGRLFVTADVIVTCMRLQNSHNI